jgi:hypothetical protein
MRLEASLLAAALPLLLAAGPTLLAQEHPEHPKSGASEHPKDGKHAGLTKTDLAVAIKSWAKKDAARHDGWVEIDDPVQKKTLELKLEKVHEDRLSRVGDDVYFACADFVEKDGTKYDIDVFMKGKTKDDLQSTEVSVHKVNAKERYTWFEEKGIWKKKPVS